MLELVNRLKESLEPSKGGKARKLTGASVEKLQQFMQTFEFRNITDDAELAKVTDQLKGIMDGVNRDKLSESGSLQKQVSKAMVAASKKLEVMTAGARKFRF